MIKWYFPRLLPVFIWILSIQLLNANESIVDAVREADTQVEVENSFFFIFHFCFVQMNLGMLITKICKSQFEFAYRLLKLFFPMKSLRIFC